MNNDSQGNGTGVGMVIGLLLVVLVIILFFFFRSSGGTMPTTPNIPATPAQEVNEGGDASIHIPDQVDINVTDGQ